MLPAFASLIFFCLVLGGIAMWVRIVSWLVRREPVLPRQWLHPVPWDGIDVLAIAAIFIATQFLCSWIAAKTFGLHWPLDPKRNDPQIDLAIMSSNMAATIETFVIGLCVLRFRAGATFAQMGFDWRYFGEDISLGLGAFLAAAPLVYGIQLYLIKVQGIEYTHPLTNAVEKNPSGLVIGLVSISAVIVAPIVEEFLFRAVLQGWLEKIEVQIGRRHAPISPPPEPIGLTSANSLVDSSPVPPDARGLFGLPLGLVPIVLSSTLFALMHTGQGAAPIPLFVFALALGFVYQRTHRLVPSITVHMALNSVSMIMFFADPLNNW